MLSRRPHPVGGGSGITSPNNNPRAAMNTDFDVSSEFNQSIAALPEENGYNGTGGNHGLAPIQKPTFLLTSTGNKSASLASAASNGRNSNGDGLANLCELEESDDDDQTPTVEVKNGIGSRVTRV